MTEQQKFLENKAYNMRKWSIVQTSEAGSGHPTSCLSAADIMSVLFFHTMRYNPRNYNDPHNDRFILSKGHASPVLYAAWKEVGVLTEADLLTYRRIDSVLEGHPTLRFSHAEAATGALGVGLSIGVGEALCAKLDKRTFKTYVLMGDAETAEGSVWEAVQLAAHYQLDNLIGIIDCNRLGQSTSTFFEHMVNRYAAILSAFGWRTLVVDGHNMQELIATFDEAQKSSGQPTMIIAKTIKGYGIERFEDKEGFHGKALKKEDLDDVLPQLKRRFIDVASYTGDYTWQPTVPEDDQAAIPFDHIDIKMPEPDYKKDEMIATRKAYGQALAVLGDVCDSVVSLDAEVKNSTFAELFEAKHPDRFFQCFVAEQNMVGMGIGFDRRGKIPFISTFGAFFSRAHDQIRMGAIGQAQLRLAGSHCGVSIGQDGPSQMALEDIAMMCALPDSIVLYPSDAVSTYKLVEQMARYDKGISYLRTTRAATPVMYENDEPFEIGKCKVVRQSEQDQICIIAAGITVEQALAAYDALVMREDSIFVSVIDLYSIKPLDVHTVTAVAHASGNRVIVVEDHYQEGGIGQIVAAALCNTEIVVESLSVTRLPRSGKPDELLAWAGIDAAAIINKVEQMVQD
jgi:transketolase